MPDRQLLKKLVGSSASSFIDPGNNLSEIFHENTKLSPLTILSYTAWILGFMRSHRVQKTAEMPYKVYTLMDRVELPAVEPRTELENTIAARRSLRSFTGEPVTREELARLLFFSYGRTDRGGRYRAVPSGGALFPLELYAVALNVTGLEQGIYHYNVEDSCLDAVRRGEIVTGLREVISWYGIDLERAACVLVFSAVFRRNTVKYKDRGYRMILMEAGEAAQNLSLLATSMGLGACLMGSFSDDNLSRFLEIDGVAEAPLLPIVVGRPAAAAPGSGVPQ